MEMEENKQCNRCDISKPQTEYWMKKGKRVSFCKDCGKKVNSAYYKSNKEQLLASSRVYHKANKESLKEYNRQQYLKNRDDRIVKAAQNRVKTKQQVEQHGLSLPNITTKECTSCNRLQPVSEFYIRKTRNTYESVCKRCRVVVERKRRDSDGFREQRRIYLQTYVKPTRTKISGNLRTRLAMIVENIVGSKTARSKELLGIDLDTFTKWLEFNLKLDGYDMCNYGKQWHMDHVIPCAAFDLENTQEQLLCFHWTNIRPLEPRSNMRKQDSILMTHLFIQEIRLHRFIQENQLQENINLSKWKGRALATALSGKLGRQQQV
jgi:hypothetical protein